MPTQTATAAQAALLLDPRRRSLLSALMAAPPAGISVAELARELGTPLRRIHYEVGKLEAAQIVQVASVEPRAGRAVRRYRMPAPWFIPFEVTQAATLEDFLAAQILPRTAGMVRLSSQFMLEKQPKWGYWLRPDKLHLGSRGGPPMRHILEGEPFVSSIGTARLTPARALELKRRLWDLLTEFEDDDAAGEDYTLSITLVRGQLE